MVPVDLKPPESHFLFGVAGGMAVGVLFGPLSFPPHPPSFGKPACKQVEAWSLNVSDSKPEVGSASAGQTSFAGVEKRRWGGGVGGRGSNGGGTSETLGCWERQEEGGGRGWESGGEQGSREKGA